MCVRSSIHHALTTSVTCCYRQEQLVCLSQPAFLCGMRGERGGGFDAPKEDISFRRCRRTCVRETIERGRRHRQ